MKKPANKYKLLSTNIAHLVFELKPGHSDSISGHRRNLYREIKLKTSNQIDVGQQRHQ